MTLGLGTAAPLPVGTSAHMAGAELTTVRADQIVK